MAKQKLFDHLDAVKKEQDPGYWESLDRASKKTWSTFMILRFLSMNPDLVPALNTLQPHLHKMEDRDAYRCLAELLPPDQRFHKYVSSNNRKRKIPKALESAMKRRFLVSEKEILQYVEILEEQGKIDELVELCRSQGFQEEDLKKVRRFLRN